MRCAFLCDLPRGLLEVPACYMHRLPSLFSLFFSVSGLCVLCGSSEAGGLFSQPGGWYRSWVERSERVVHFLQPGSTYMPGVEQ
jgi:hypothetical protein